MNAKEQLTSLLDSFYQWSTLTSKQDSDWAEGFADIEKLVRLACELACETDSVSVSQQAADIIAKVVSLTDESERAIEAIIEAKVPTTVLTKIAGAGDWKCRWQVYSHLDCASHESESLAYSGTWDPNYYVSRRAFLALIESGSPMAQVAAERLVDSQNDVTKKIAISFVNNKHSGQKLIDEDND